MTTFFRNLAMPIILVVASGVTAFAQPAVYNVKDYGAKADGRSLDTKAIDKAITAASAAGGGTIFFPAGDYLSVTIHLKSNVGLYLDHGATIIAATPTEGVQYDSPEKSINSIYQDYGHSYFHNSLIVGENLHDISITGPGRIWGKGLLRQEAKSDQRDGYGNKTIALKLCRNVILKDFTVAHGGWFCFLLTGVDNLTMDNLKMDTNRDGIDLISSKNVHITNCSVNSPNDDGIVLKSDFALNYPRSLENVTISDCTVSGYKEGSFLDGTYIKDRKAPTGRIKIGTESNGGFKNIAITNCTFDYCRGLALETVDGAALEDITISNITMRDICNAPLFIRLGARMRGPKDFPYSQLHRVLISNIIAYNVTSDQGAIISGIPGHDIEDLTLSNINIYFKGGGTKSQAANQVPAEIKSYPEPERFGITPSYGFFIRNVKGLRMNDISVHFLKDDLRPAFVLDSVEAASLYNINAQKVKDPSVFTFALRSVKDFSLGNSEPLGDIKLSNVMNKEL